MFRSSQNEARRWSNAKLSDDKASRIHRVRPPELSDGMGLLNNRGSSPGVRKV